MSQGRIMAGAPLPPDPLPPLEPPSPLASPIPPAVVDPSRLVSPPIGPASLAWLPALEPPMLGAPPDPLRPPTPLVLLEPAPPERPELAAPVAPVPTGF